MEQTQTQTPLIHRWPHATLDHAEKEVAASSYPFHMERRNRLFNIGDKLLIGDKESPRHTGTIVGTRDGEMVNLHVVWR